MSLKGRILAGAVALGTALGLASPAAAQFGGACDREMLQEVAGKYLEAQRTGTPLLIPMGNWMVYNENFKLSSMSTGLLSKPLAIDHHLMLLDETQCRVFLEMIVTDEASPIVFAAQFTVRGGNASNVQVITSEKDDWLFDAQATYEYARREDWGTISEGQRNSREEIKAAADAYLDLFKDKSVEVPWGTPCARLEGGIYTARGTPEDSCEVGVPDDVDMVEREYVIDETIGAVSVFLKMGQNRRPDSHLFRIEDGKLRYVHTVTNCGEQVNCGFRPFEEMLKDNPDMQPPPVG